MGGQGAVLKAGGSGLTFPLDRYGIELSADEAACRLIVADDSLSIVPPVIQFLQLEQGWIVSVAAGGNGWKVPLCT